MTRKIVSIVSVFVLLSASLVGAVIAWKHLQPARATGFPQPHFAPYVDMSAYPQFALSDTAQFTGSKFYTLAFILDGGSCKAAWGGVTPLSGDPFQSDIERLRQDGGDVVVSFGGAAGVELAQICAHVASLQAEYQAVVTKYNLTHLDFDIEGSSLADALTVERRNKAIAALQASASKEGKPLSVSFTLPALPTGLTPDGVNLLRNALANGVKVDIVNMMAMDYGNGVAAPDRMGVNAIEAATSLQKQLHELYPALSSAQLWGMVGITPMVGMNDVSPEIFTLEDAQQVLTFAQQKQIGRLAMWSMNRDRACPYGGKYVSPSCSGIQQQNYAFTQTFRRYNGQVTPTPVTPTPFSSGGTPTSGATKTTTATLGKTPTPGATGTATPTPGTITTATPLPGNTPTPGKTPTPVPVITPTVVAPQPGQNVTNPGFETGSLSGWNCSGGTGVQKNAYSGSYALVLGADDAQLRTCKQVVSVQPGRTYTVQAYVKGNYAFLGIEGVGETWSTGSDYGLLSYTFTTADATSSVTIVVHGWYAQGEVLVDDVALR